MFHFYDGYHFIGMHLLWWVFWLAFIPKRSEMNEIGRAHV